ncbi:HdeD family acid-resistance protein [Scytonema sp. PCC 10023]|uniref:HdeD family acid-resistance protein n=1 Tax=Scytonema sp. PCC 10023 TaxID=1680591 RepID=UPI0039C656BA
MTTNVSGDINKSDINKGDINKATNNSLLIGILLTVLGIAAFAVPTVTTIFAETWIALILISSAAAKLSYAFQTRHEGGFVWKLLLSILYFATGVMLFVYPLTGVLTLTLLLGSFLLTEGVFELVLAFRLRPQQNWTWALGNGVITLLLGAMIWFQWPFNAPWVIGTLVGVSILSTGVSRVMLSLNSRYALNHSDSAAQA